ncbi:lytic murein transglycosylase [Rhodopseudomonas palustris]|nr:lytic murein transglycosylase [Rhodopseudomonas palustris]OPF92743.1 lytic transglycosylase [Rhodopseudomonas palustris]RJF65251.1 lytic murein transglycosylase [Rhodopseudomonas palustris]WAB80203.1 lytic murein transglycosylase [Rhodopseudomonas palustris]WCL94593.1 lytic murein transglycosylase [Rhodopseudomonas palustris CGA009]WND54097.1 lytic murein transglycosylase [Rhodopseudomonas palustris]
MACAAAAISAATLLSSPAFAQRGASCHGGQSFPQFLAGLKQKAVAAGVSQGAIAEASPYLVYDQGIVNRDRGQRVFGQIFTVFAGRMASEGRRVKGQQLIKQYANAFARAEKEYGVPPAVITAFWALESDFGAVQGNLPTLRSLVSLAYDCRRSEMFQDETIAALKIIDRGDLTPGEMIGSWAGELGQTQFLPRHYFDYAVDYDGDGHRDLLHSAPDVIGSTANYIATGLKWRRGEPWLQEVRVPENLPWDQADLTVKHPRSQWAQWGVTTADGRPLSNDALPASLLLPMGRHGPAFLAYANFAAYTEWNNSLIYSTTAAYLATRIAGAGPMQKPRAAVAQLSFNEMKQLQQLLVRAGFDVGKVDGVLGQQTRSAVKTMQLKYGLPADSWPTAELLTRMGGSAAPAPSASAEPMQPTEPRRAKRAPPPAPLPQ